MNGSSVPRPARSGAAPGWLPNLAQRRIALSFNAALPSGQGHGKGAETGRGNRTRPWGKGTVRREQRPRRHRRQGPRDTGSAMGKGRWGKGTIPPKERQTAKITPSQVSVDTMTWNICKVWHRIGQIMGCCCQIARQSAGPGISTRDENPMTGERTVDGLGDSGGALPRSRPVPSRHLGLKSKMVEFCPHIRQPGSSRGLQVVWPKGNLFASRRAGAPAECNSAAPVGQTRTTFSFVLRSVRQKACRKQVCSEMSSISCAVSSDSEDSR